ncbi:MAG TPA: TonB-dependent receptor [Bryobacteraceae bacterium]|nr:TonB-dependent receptor [Bryobacteraceae bacterium]
MRTKLFVVTSFLLSVPLMGQTLGEITGRISDPSGAGVPDAALTLTSTATNAARQTRSTADGDYSFPLVPPGLYKVKVEHPGFKIETNNSVEVQVQQTVRLDFTLQVGDVTQTVEISASANMLQAENATLGSVVSNTSIVQLPLNGRQYLNLVALNANVNTLSPPAGQSQSRQGGDRSNESISAGGNRIFFDYFTLDGVNNTDVDFNTYIVLPSIDAIQEFKVQTGVYPAEFGHGATQINVLTKSGGNLYHGSLFEFLRNDDMDANNSYAFTANRPIKSPFRWNDYGYELDGPVRIPKLFDGRNKLFFMSNFETLVEAQSAQAVYSLPTAAMQQGNYSAWPTTIYQPNSGGVPFPGNVIPTSQLSPTSQALLKYYDAATLPGFVNNYTQYNQSPLNRDGFIIRMDFVESAKSQWSGRYSWGSEVQKSGGLTITGTKITTGYEQYLGSNTRILSPNLVNEARFGYSRIFNAISTADAFTVNPVGALGIPNMPAGPPVQWGVPSVSFSGDGFSSLGDNSDDPYQISDNTTQLVDNLSWIKGKHTFKFGFEYNRQNFDQYGNQFLRGQFTFSANATQSPTHTAGDAFAEFLLGDFFQSTVAFQAANANYQRNIEAAFIDDTWKITPKLTLSLGLRYELTPPFYDTNNNLFQIVIPQILAVSAVPQSSGLWPYMIRQGNCQNPYTANPPIPFIWAQTPAVCSNGLEDGQLLKVRYNDFAPRIGIAWSPDSKTVVRAAVGEFFVQDNGNSMYFDPARNIGVRLTLTANIGGTTWANGSGVESGLAATYANAVTPPGAGGAPTPFPPPYGYVAAYSHHTSYTTQYLLNVQRQLSANWSVEAGYLGSESHHLYGFFNANNGIPGTVGSSISRLPFADFGVIQLVADGVNADYNSLSFKVTKRFSQGLSVLTNYTYSRSIDDSSGIRVQGYDSLFPQNSYCIKCERGPSAFNVPQRWVTSVLYELPVGKGKPLNITNGVLNAIIGGWQTGGTMTVMQGLPVSLTIGGVDNSETDEAYDRPNYIGGPVNASNQIPAHWYNPSAFAEGAPGTFGNVGRNTMLSPGIFVIDTELHKDWVMPYSEHHRLQLRFEAFNVLNHPNFGEPNPNILAGAAIAGAPAGTAHASFGVIGGLAAGTTMRQLQVAMKYTF